MEPSNWNVHHNELRDRMVFDGWGLHLLPAVDKWVEVCEEDEQVWRERILTAYRFQPPLWSAALEARRQVEPPRRKKKKNMKWKARPKHLRREQARKAEERKQAKRSASPELDEPVMVG